MRAQHRCIDRRRIQVVQRTGVLQSGSLQHAPGAVFPHQHQRLAQQLAQAGVVQAFRVSVTPGPRWAKRWRTASGNGAPAGRTRRAIAPVAPSTSCPVAERMPPPSA